jgi:hypothetical protein
MTTIKIEGIRINLPPDITSTHVVGASGHSYLVHVDSDGTYWVDMSVEDCESLLLNSAPAAAPWRASNWVPFQQLGGQVQKPEVGIRIADVLQAVEDSRPLHPKDIRGTLRELGRLR